MRIYYESHGGKGTLEYNSWQNMKSRCLNLNHPRYCDYGGRGIKVCDRWIHSFSNFRNDMGYRPNGMTLDRIDNDGGYSPSNCQWSTVSEQNTNQRARKDNTSGKVGVSEQRNGKFLSYINCNLQRKRIGLFNTLDEAINARSLAEREIRG